VLQNRRGYSTLFWIGFLMFCLIPLVALAVNLGRFFYARAEMYKVADAAALAAAQEVDIPLYRQTGQIVLLPSAYGKAAEYANLNAGYLHSRRIYPFITNITVDQARHAVSVSMAASADELVPLIGNLTLRGSGEAQVRGLHNP
jgi:putative Flp pilus-assembly TadE/G-like protein